MSACLSSGGGGAAAYSFELEKVKSPLSTSTTTTTTTRAISPSSTLSESSNSPLSISTRKPRTQRKRPNQTYNEATALLSTAYPNIFSSNFQKTQPFNSHFYGIVKSPLLSDNDEASELLFPYESIEEPDFLFNPSIETKSEFFLEQKEANFGAGVGEIEKFDYFSDEFDAESILDEEIEEGIDSIMGAIVDSNSNLGISESRVPGMNRGKRSSNRIGKSEQMMMMINSWNRSSNGFGNLPLGLGLRSDLRKNDDSNLWSFHTIDFEQISPRIKTATTTSNGDKKQIVGEKSKKKKKKKKNKSTAVTPLIPESKSLEETEGTSLKRTGLLLKLDYDGVLEAWSGKTSPFADEILGSEAMVSTSMYVKT